MERHQIIDFHFAPHACVLWVVLDSVPSDEWVARLDGALDDEVRRVRPAVSDGDLIYLRVDGTDECEALTLLAEYVWAANATLVAHGRVRPKRAWPRLRDRS
jgi:hypothetical protein